VKTFLLALASVGFIGCLPYSIVPFKKWKGGGLLGSLAGWVMLWALPSSGAVLWTVFVIVAALSIPICGYAERCWNHDDPRIVLDEVVGVWVACLLLPRAIVPMMFGLVLFRVFDVWKGPWGRTTARLPGGWGVVADDVAAGIIAFFLSKILLVLFL
jgi:phosphatidylglycerophosphatase A